MRTGPTSGVRTGLTPGARPSSSQPTRFVSARYVAPAAARNRRRVILLPIVKLYTNPSLPHTRVVRNRQPAASPRHELYRASEMESARSHQPLTSALILIASQSSGPYQPTLYSSYSAEICVVPRGRAK